MLNPWFSGLYLAGFLFLITLELIGVHRKKAGDTITENWRFLDKRLHGPLQWGWRVMTAGALVWTLFHFGGNWK